MLMLMLVLVAAARAATAPPADATAAHKAGHAATGQNGSQLGNMPAMRLQCERYSERVLFQVSLASTPFSVLALLGLLLLLLLFSEGIRLG